MAILIATLSPASRIPGVDAQDLTAEDEAWIEQRIAEAGVYLGGGADTATLSPPELPEFEDLYRDCLYVGLQATRNRSATLDFCAETLLSPLAEPQEWFSGIDDFAVGYLEALRDDEVEPFIADLAYVELRDCLKGLARTRFLELDEAQQVCDGEARARVEEALRPPTPTPRPTPVLGTPTPVVTPAMTPVAPGLPTPLPGVPGVEVVYRADQTLFSGDNAHLTWINAGPIDTRVSAGVAEIRLDAATARMRAPANLNVSIVAESTEAPTICSHTRMELQGSAPIVEGSATADEGMVINFNGTLIRTFDGPNCPPEREFRSQGPITSVRVALVQDPERNENIVAFCSLALLSATTVDCARAAIAILRPVRP